MWYVNACVRTYFCGWWLARAYVCNCLGVRACLRVHAGVFCVYVGEVRLHLLCVYERLCVEYCVRTCARACARASTGNSESEKARKRDDVNDHY